ncbi:aldo/keto reductase [Mangrovibacterium marinum]|uniref:D-threo-aldose 1-dehydrogenase n=1 Tax=Mangrovibacterium marinum TaxID=1639118 RepID=A0A2T5BZR2_9BACT|nr:aldo/keto reductase [Mangrovibacterium marinum]PTN07789.1 D-threo-aldose 1-dehydrogenase [Mangrovibacterium marinum]
MKKLGQTEVNCPRIIYGTSYLGNLYRELSWEQKLSLIREWFMVADGKVMIDSAGKYGAGLALEVIGQGLEALGVAPDQITISNKLGWYRVPLAASAPTFEPGVWAKLEYDAVQKISYDGILECWEQGCELLGNTYKPELVSVHDPDEYLAAALDAGDRQQRLKDIVDAYAALFELKEQGDVKAVGVGAKDWQVIRELYSRVKFDWVMLANTFTLYHYPREVIAFLRQLQQDGVGVINSGIFNAGFLTGGEYFDYRLVCADKPADKPLFEWRDRFFAVCDRYAITPGDACFKFALSAPQIQAVALNPGKPSRMAHNKALLDADLPISFWKALKNEGLIDPDYPYL